MSRKRRGDKRDTQYVSHRKSVEKNVRGEGARRKKYEGKKRCGARTDEAKKLMKFREGMKFREWGCRRRKKVFFFAKYGRSGRPRKRDAKHQI
jgi:hypothetical protein